MNELNDIEKEILRKFIYKDKLKYNEIWTKELCSSSHFDYYFKKLIKDGIIAKSEDFYKLTPQGLKFISNLDGKTIKENPKPISCSFFLPIKDDNILIHKRGKQPFLGYIGLAGGKIEYGNSSLKQAKIELLEETNLEGDFEWITLDDLHKTNDKIPYIEDNIRLILENYDDVKHIIRHRETKNGKFVE